MAYRRLRQLCLVAKDLELPARQFTSIFGLAEAHREPRIEHLGLSNVIIPLGETPVFIEIVAPIRADTAAGRFLERRGGDAAYMFIADCDDLDAARGRADSLGLRVITANDWPDPAATRSFQLHPRDTGAAIVEIDHHGTGEDMFGPYRWAGPAWRDAVRADLVRAVKAVEIQSQRPLALARLWADLFGVRLRVETGAAPGFELDNVSVSFPTAPPGGEEAISRVRLDVVEPDLIRERARAAGVPLVEGEPVICGVRFSLEP